MIKRIRKNKKGFTLAELLIVVAIIGVLVAVSIPIFTAQLEKSRESTDMANLRAAKAAAVSTYLTDEGPLVSITNGAKSYVTCYYDIQTGRLVTDPIGGGVGRGTSNNPETYSSDTNEYGYDSANIYTGKNIVVTATDTGVTVAFQDDTGTESGSGSEESGGGD